MMEELKQILDAVADGPTGVSQFTIDWAESRRDELIEREEGEVYSSNSDYTSALCYKAENILEIMKLDLPDVLFFERVQKVAGQIPV